MSDDYRQLVWCKDPNDCRTSAHYIGTIEATSSIRNAIFVSLWQRADDRYQLYIEPPFKWTFEDANDPGMAQPELKVIDAKRVAQELYEKWQLLSVEAVLRNDAQCMAL